MNKAWRYYEGTTSANSIIKDISKVLCTAVKTEEVKDGEGNVIKNKEIIMNKNWDVVYPIPNKDQINVMDWSNLTPAEFLLKVDNQLSKANDTVILKTKTTMKDLSNLTNVDDLGLENDLSKDSVEMYMELYKPTYMADPEKYHPECERVGLMPYNITADIYRDYANSTGETEINIKSQFTGQTGISVQELKETINKTKYYDGSTSMQTELNKLNAALGTNYKTTSGEYTITVLASDLEKIKGTDAENFMCGILGIDTTTLYKYTLFTIKVDGTYNRNTISINGNRSYEHYTISAGFKFALPELEKVDATSIKFVVGSNVQGDSTWRYDRNTCEFEIIKTITGATESIGEPIVSYEFEKEQTAITGRKLLYNNHYIFIRMFDKIKDDFSGPVENTIDEKTGEILQINSHVSEWSKLSWYQDYEEVMIDSLDADVGSNDISNGIINLPIETPGLTGDTRLRFWVNCNNDRAIFVFMGNPSLDFGKNRHLISVTYLGQIESFDNSINDTAGNFTIFTSSSTVPCASRTIKKRVTMSDDKLIGVGGSGINQYSLQLEKDKYFDSMGTFKVVYEDSNGNLTSLNIGEAFSLEFSGDKSGVKVNLFSPPPDNTLVNLQYDYYVEKYESVEGVQRDGYGNVINTSYPNTWGKNTATGVIDVCMLATRSKAYFQKHHLMFTTTEEYMTKEQYGKSAYTGEYYADRIKITHGNDGPRGMLADCLAIDTSSLYAFDELIVNRDFLKDSNKPEETYVFFPVTAPYSPFSGSPNATFGFAIKKAIRDPQPLDDAGIVDAAIVNLDVQVGNLMNLTEDVVLPNTGLYESTIEWTSSETTLITIETTV